MPGEARPYFRWSRIRVVPASYTADGTINIVKAPAGAVIASCFVQVNVAFDGTNSNATLSVGDAGSTSRFATTTNTGLTVTGLKQGTGAGFNTTPGYLYTAETQITASFVADTGGNGTVGNFDIWIEWYRPLA